MTWLDGVAIAGYFAVLLGIGIRVMRKDAGSQALGSFLAANRNMGLAQTTASTAATDLGGGFSIAMGGLGFTLGISGSWLIAISGLSVLMAAFLLVPRLKLWSDATGGLTTGDLFTARFGPIAGRIAALVVALSWFSFVGGQIVAGGKLLQATLELSIDWAIGVAGVVILGYTAMGGLKAVIYTDVFQMVVLFLGIVILLVPLALIEVGGVAEMIAYFKATPETASMVDWTAVDLKQMLGWFLAVFPVWFVSIAAMQRVIAARNAKVAQQAFVITGVPIEWPLFAISATLVGMLAKMLIPDLTDPELATPMMILTVLPMGLAGIVIAAYIAAVMSTADSCLIGPVAIVTHDFYRGLWRKQASDQELLRVARWLTLILGVLAIGLAYRVPSIIDVILYAYTFAAAGLFFPMLALLYWPRATAAGATTSMILGGGAAVIWMVSGEPFDLSAAYLGWGVGLPSLVLVSLLTKHSQGENLDLFRRPNSRS